MKTKAVKRAEAVERLRASRYEDSKAKRKGTLTREEWEERKNNELRRLA